MPPDSKPVDPLLAYILPFVLYVVPTTFESGNGLGLPYEFVCTAKGLLAIIALWWFRAAYPEWNTRGFRLGTVAGVAGILIWILLARVQSLFPEIPFAEKWLVAGKRMGFNPFQDGGPSLGQMAFLAVRFAQLTIVVPLVEEIFWRGFLSRYLIADDFLKVTPGTFSTFSFWFVALAFASVHPEILAALVWCIMINLLYAKTGNLWACVLMHSVTNGLLGLYVVITGNWNLW